MSKRTAKQEVIFRKAFDGVALSEKDKLGVFALSFSDRSTLGMVRQARRKAIAAGKSPDDWRCCG